MFRSDDQQTSSTGVEYTAERSAPLAVGERPYWFARARILRDGNSIYEAELTLSGPEGEPRHLAAIEEKLVQGEFSDADHVMDEVKDLVECEDDSSGSASVKSYLAGWICADVVGRCLK